MAPDLGNPYPLPVRVRHNPFTPTPLLASDTICARCCTLVRKVMTVNPLAMPSGALHFTGRPQVSHDCTRFQTSTHQLATALPMLCKGHQYGLPTKQTAFFSLVIM